ncbi:MAG: FAD:protein FMN transferase [Candidatus Micrarchaeota archaeon]
MISRSEELLGTVVEIKLPERHSNLFSACFEEIRRIERAYSRFLADSELSRLNCRLGEWQDASPEMLFLVSKGMEFRGKTGGNFDITLKAVLDEIGYRSASSAKSPGKDGPDILVDAKNSRILLNKEIEFGGFGKGYALDRVSRLLGREGAGHYYINAGGDIYAKGEPWPVLLEHPDDSTRAIGKVSLDGRAIAGSAPNRRRWGGYHHLINAKTKKPASGVKAIFVIADTGMEADAYATALFTAGFAEGIELSGRLPVEALIISAENKMYESEGFGAEMF